MEQQHAVGATRFWQGFVPDRGGDENAPPVNGQAWRISVIGLHGAFGLVVALAAVSVAVSTGPGVDKAIALSALAVLTLAYLGFGAMAIAAEAPRRAVVYLVVLVLALGFVGRAAPDSLFLLFIAYPQVWFLTERPRPGIRWTVLLALSSTIGYGWALLVQDASLLGAVITAVVGLGFSVGMGVWTSRVIDQSRQRAELIGQLEATRAELAASHHEQGVMAERERLAREVHDTLAQGYTSIVMLAQTATAALPARPAVASERLELIEEVARDNLREARAVVAAFSPVPLQDTTLREALARLAQRFDRETGTAVHLELGDLDLALSRAQEVVLLRTAQEALTNVRRHARAASVTVRLAEQGGAVSVQVIDDGVGFDPATTGSGLTGLRTRVEQAGGGLDVISAPGAGTRVVGRLPNGQESAS